MALELHETTKHSRVYREVMPDGSRRGYCRSTISPMHFESVPGSGDYDTPIDVDVKRVTTSELDGYEMTSAGWHFRLQVVDPAASTAQPNTQRAAGSVGFGGRMGERWFYFKLADMGYVHWPTRDVTRIGGDADYSSVPTLRAKKRNLGHHKAVDDDVVTVNTCIEWPALWTAPNGGTISLRWGVKAGALKEEVIVDELAREWLATAGAPDTADDETFFSFRFDLDISDVPKFKQGGSERDLDADDFDDDDGSVELRGAADELLAFMPLDYVYSTRRGGKRALRKRFYKSGGNNYLLVGVRVDHMKQLLPGKLIFDPTMTQEQVASGANDASQYTTDDATINNPHVVLGGLPWYGYPYPSRCGFRFTPSVPAGASFTKRDEYAMLTTYKDDYWGGKIAGYYEGYYYPIPLCTAFADVASNDQPVFAENSVDSPEPGSNWTDSAASTNFMCAYDQVQFVTGVARRTPGDPLPKIDVSAQMEEVCALPGWASGNGMRFRLTPHEDTGYPQNSISIEAYADIAAKAAVLDAYYNSPAYPRTLGHNDTLHWHNTVRTLDFKDENKRHNNSGNRHKR